MSDIPTYCFSIISRISFYTIPLTFFLVSKDYIEEFLFLFLSSIYLWNHKKWNMKFLLLPFFRTCQLVCLHSCSSFERLHAFFSIAFFLSCASLFFDSWLTRKCFFFFFFSIIIIIHWSCLFNFTSLETKGDLWILIVG